MNRPRIKSTQEPGATNFELEPLGKAPEDWRTPSPSDFRMLRTTRSVLECASPLALSPVSVPPRSTRTKAFTLVGTIGALAVIAVLVGVIAPSVVRRVDHATWTRETADLQTIADAYTQYILTNKTIPGTNTWASSVASYMSLPVSSITTNSRRFARAFLVDPAFQIGTNVAGQVYTQTSDGTSKPVSARVMFISSLARALPISTGTPSNTVFNAIWDTPEGATPATGANWGSGDDLRIKRLNLEPLFHQLILVERDAANQIRFSIDSTNVMNVPTTNTPPGLNRCYLDGTTLSVYTTTATNSTNCITRQQLKRNTSYIFESGTWSDGTPSPPASSGTGSDFVNHAITFFSSRSNPYTSVNKGASQYSAMIAMYTFMFDYSLWANECPHFSHHGSGTNSSPTSIPEYILLNNEGQNSSGNIDNFSSALIATPTGSGSSP